MIPVTSPFPQYFDTDGSPLDAGYIYYGEPNENPETSPIVVYWDAAGTVPAAQPIRTLNGYPVRNSTPAQLFASEGYSVTVKNRRGTLVLYGLANRFSPVDSPAFTGTPTAPTPGSADNSTRIATTAWAKFGFAISLGPVGYIKFPTWLGGLIVQWGTSVVTTDGAAQAAFPFPLTFPSNVYTTVANIGDNGDNKTAVFGTTGTSVTTARFVLVDSTTGGGRAAFVARINWVAFGN